MSDKKKSALRELIAMTKDMPPIEPAKSYECEKCASCECKK